MIGELIDIAAWRARLEKQGHDVVAPVEGETAIGLRPAPEKIVTVSASTRTANGRTTLLVLNVLPHIQPTMAI